MRRTPLVALLAGVLLLTAAACPPTGSDVPGRVVRDGDVVRGTGTVEWFSLEGGFFAIRGDDDRAYEPINLPAELREDGLRVRNDLGSYRMVGPVVEIQEIARQ